MKKSPFESELILAHLSPEEALQFKKQWEELTNQSDTPTSGIQAVMYNEPKHYHQHQIDTIEFLKRGFPPDVFLHFCLGNVVKYAQRAQYKNGIDDYVKMVDYANRAIDWHRETHSK